MTVTVENLDPTGTFNVAYNPAAGFVYDWTVSDPGSDDLTVTLEIGPLTPVVEVYYNDGIGQDPDPSPYSGTAPFEVTENNILSTSLPPGVYDCYLTVEDDDLGTYTTSTQVTVPNQPPVADFSYSPLNPLKDELIQFTDSSTDPDGSVVAWSWDFGDGATSIDQNPTHSYSVIDSYTVMLTVWDDHNDMDSITKTVGVVNQPPVAVFSYTPNGPLTSEIVTFTDFSYDPDGSVVSWLYDFGDGATSPDQNPTHSYATSGSFTLTLMVWDEFGAMDTARKNIDVQNRPPVAEFSFTPDDPLVFETVTFTDLSTDPDDSVVSWFWDFGDGTMSTDQYPIHPYSESGPFTVTLTVWDEHDNYDSVSKSVVVDKEVVENQAPVAEFEYEPSTPEVDMDVDFTDLSSDPDGTIVQWEWDFGDDTTSDEKNPTHLYTTAGTYIVTLKVYDDSGDFAIASQEILVVEAETPSNTVYYFPWWIFLIIGVVILLLFLLLLFWHRRKKRKEEEEA